jgi:hypothetical protein
MFLPLYCVSFGLRLLIIPSSFSLSLCSCHCIVCPSVYGFWLPLQAFLVFMFLPLYCVSFGLRILITPSSFSLSVCSCHCIVCPSVYGFWLPLQSFLVCMFLSLYCVSFGLRLLINPSSFSCLYVLTIVLCVLRFTASDYPLKLFLSVCSCHCIVCPSVYGFWLPLQAFLVFMFLPLYCVSFGLRLLITLQGFLVFMFLPWYCVSFGLRLLITPWSCSCLYVLAIVLCILRFTASDYSFKLFLSLCSCHCIVCLSVYGFWLSLQGL